MDGMGEKRERREKEREGKVREEKECSASILHHFNHCYGLID